MNNMTTDTGPVEKPVLIPIEAYVSETYAREENEKLWPKVWQIACREEELKKVGDYVTYEILDESIIVVRSASDKISAYYNACKHRGRRLTEGCGHTKQFFCKFHGWRWNIDGESQFVLDAEDWEDTLTKDNLRLTQVKVDCWGGWVWINMDPNCEPLRDYLSPACPMLDAFEFEKMRYRWRQWLYFPCNWKTALESFIESYHVDATHPQLTNWGTNRWWSRAEGKHAWHGVGPARGGAARAGAGSITVGAQEGQDPRVTMAELFKELWTTVGTTTQTLVDAAERLKDEVPEGTPPDQIAAHLMMSAAKADAERGVFWPQMSPEHYAACGLDWHIFPNSAILPGITYALCYRSRPNGYDPNSCIFEVYILERYPEGQEPNTEWVYEPDPGEEKWQRILAQDFKNMPEIQRGMKSRGFAGPRPSPKQEIPIIHFHRTLAEYMGTGAPVPLK
jgi:nitrite reductase/ring-hydroxylating ferredoxin subunit